VQVDSMKPGLTALGTNLLTLKYDEALPTFAFNSSLRRYTKVDAKISAALAFHWARPGHSSSLHLNMTVCS